VIPVIGQLIEKLAGNARVAVSIDTMKPGVARAALAAGACIVNDVAASRSDAALWRVVAEFRAGYVCMHAQGSPPDMQKNPVYADVVREVGEFFSERLQKLPAHGIAVEQVMLDPGIGFGKSIEHNLGLLAGLRNFMGLGRPLLLGVSRKSFLEKITGSGVNERLPAALACATLALADGVQVIRTHDVKETVQALRLAEAVLARRKNV
jgi:dihydropteroate synthase